MSEPKELYASGGLITPLPKGFRQWWEGDDIWHNGVAPTYRNRTLRGRIKNFFAWDKDWGLPLRGGPHPKLRDMMPTFRTVRGGIRFG